MLYRYRELGKFLNCAEPVSTHFDRDARAVYMFTVCERFDNGKAGKELATRASSNNDDNEQRESSRAEPWSILHLIFVHCRTATLSGWGNHLSMFVQIERVPSIINREISRLDICDMRWLASLANQCVLISVLARAIFEV